MARLVQEWQVKLGQIDELDVEAIMRNCQGTELGRELGADPTGAGTADNDSEGGL